MKMQMFLRSGGVVTVVDVTEFETTRSKITGEFTHLNWTTPDGWTSKLHSVRLEEVIAFVALADGSPSTGDGPEGKEAAGKEGDPS